MACAVPKSLLTSQMNLAFLLDTWTSSLTRVPPSSRNSPKSLYHLIVGNGMPVPAQVKVAVLPSATVTSIGGIVIAGAAAV